MSDATRPTLFGVTVAPLTLARTVEQCRRSIEHRRPLHHASLNAFKVVLMDAQPRLREVLRHCELINADGQSVVWAARLLGRRLPERVAGIDLMEAMLALAEHEGWPVFFLGSRPEVLEQFLRVVHRRHPRLSVAGHQHGYFDDESAVRSRVRDSGARLLFVGMPSPRKEYMLADWMPQLGPLFAMGVGGSFDVWAGRTRRAPRWARRAGLEWLYRWLQEPRRMWRRYLLGNLRFAAIVLRELRRS